MSTKQAADLFAQAKALAETQPNHTSTALIAAGLMELADSLRKDMSDMENQLRELQRLIRRLG